MRHSRWAIRHVGAGLWVSAQRPLYAILRLIQAAVMGTDASVTVGAESDAFYYAGTQFTCFIGTKVQILTQKRYVIALSLSLREREREISINLLIYTDAEAVCSRILLEINLFIYKIFEYCYI